MTWLLRLVVVVAVAAFVGLPARPATAHAAFVAAIPAAGSSLPQAPGSVVLRFTEPLGLALSSVDVLDSADQIVTAGPMRPVEGDPNGMRRPLELLTPDVYTVRWTTVSTLDGHSLYGSYTFGVGTSAAKNEQVAANPVASEGWLGLVGRWVALVGLGAGRAPAARHHRLRAGRRGQDRRLRRDGHAGVPALPAAPCRRGRRRGHTTGPGGACHRRRGARARHRPRRVPEPATPGRGPRRGGRVGRRPRGRGCAVAGAAGRRPGCRAERRAA